MQRIEPTHGESHSSAGERWALVQRLSGTGTNAGEWFSTPADIRAVDLASKRLIKQGEPIDSTLMETLASRGNAFGGLDVTKRPLTLMTPSGSANAVSMQSAIASSSRPNDARTLGDVLLRKASLKMAQWKKRPKAGGFGSIVRLGECLIKVAPTDRTVSKMPVRSTWAPTFGPTYDSSDASGGAGLYSSIDAVYERSWCVHKSNDTEQVAQTGWWGSLEPSDDENESTMEPRQNIDHIFAENRDMIEELQEWQSYRAGSLALAEATEREQLVGES